jgi:transposase InsO family protein
MYCRLEREQKDWIAAVGAKTAYIERGSPWENGYIESFNGKLRVSAPPQDEHDLFSMIDRSGDESDRNSSG